MKNLKKKIKKSAKRILASFLMMTTIMWSLGASLITLTPVAEAAVTVGTQPTETIASGQTAKASSSNIPIVKFAISQDAAETLSSVTVTIADAGTTGVASADIASLKVFKDDGDEIFNGTDSEAGSQTTVNIGSATTITTSVNNAIGTTATTFFVTLATSASWSDANPADAITVSMAVDGIATSANSPTVTALTGANSLTADTTAPTVTAVEQINPSAVEVTFSEIMNSGTATTKTNYTFANPALNVIDAVQQGPNIFRIVADGDITAGTTTLTVGAGVTDPAGNANATTTAQAITKPVKIKISEVSAEMGSADAEFVEIYNAGDAGIDINGWAVQYSADGSSWSALNTIGASTTIPAFSFYLFSTAAFDSASSVAGDANFTAGLDLAGGHIRIINSSSSEVDKIGWGTAASPEGTAIAAHTAGQSFERKAFGESTVTDMSAGGMDEIMGNGWDTGDNSFDFVVQTTPNPQNSSSVAEQTDFTAAGGPMIMHMPINSAVTGADLNVIAQMGDPMTPIDQIVAELHYMVGDGTPAAAAITDFTTILGTHQSNGFFKFTIPQAAIDDANTATNGLYYYLKVVTDGGTRFMSANPEVDMASVGSGLTYETYAAQEADIAKNPFIISVAAAGTTYAISGTVTDDTSTAIESVLVFAEGTGYNTTTNSSGTYTLSVPDGIYNLVMIKSGYYEEWISDIFVNGGNVTGVDRTMFVGTGGGMTGDSEKPFVMWTGPPDGMMGIPSGMADFKIFIGFSKDLDASTFNSTSVVLSTDGSTQVASAVTYDNDPSTRNTMYPMDSYLGIVDVPTAGLAENTTYYLVMDGTIRDTAGNALQGNRPEGGHTISFTTGLAGGSLDFADFGTGAMMPPFVAGTTPYDGAMNVVTNTKININFSDPMDSTTVNSTNIKLYKITYDNYSEVKTAVGLSSVSLDTSGQNATLTPASALASGKHRVVVSGALKSATGIWMGDPGQSQNVSTYEFYWSEFEVGTTSDSTAPTVLGSWPANGDTGIAVNPGIITIQFSEGMDPSTINSNTITLKRGTSAVTGNISYDPMAQSASFSPSVVLATSADYTLTVTTGVTDAVGNALASNEVIIFTTSATGDSSAPSIMFANGDDYGIAITFSEPMNSANAADTADYPTSVLNSANYIVKQGAPGTDFSTGGTAVDLSNAKFKYDGMGNTVMIDGLSGTVGNDYYIDMTPVNVSGTGAADLSGNAISGGTTFQMPINSSFDTKGMLGPMMGGGDMMSPDMGDMGMMGAGAFPMNAMAGQTTIYFVDVPTTKAIPNGGKLVLTFPVGFDVSGAKKDPYSPVNNDINEWNDGTIAFSGAAETSGGANNDGVTVNSTTRAVTVTFAVTGTPPTADFLHLDLAGIVNSSIPRGFETSGYTVDMKTMDASGNLLETITAMPFFINEGGSSTLTGSISGIDALDVDGVSDTVKVFLGSPMTGPMEATAAIADDGSGSYSFSGLVPGQYMIFTDPSITLDGNDYEGNPMPQPITISAGANTKNIALIEAGTGAVATVTVTLTGDFSTGGSNDNIDIFAGSPNGFKVKTVNPNDDDAVDATAGSLDTTNGDHITKYNIYLPAGTWNVGIGPAMPKGPMAGPPPMPDWMPPMPTQIVSDGTTAQNLSISISNASMQIVGYVQDEAGNAIADAETFAYQPMGTGMGAYAKTDTNGRFTLKVTAAGTYSVGAFKSGLPSAQDKTVKVSADSSITGGDADGNSTADVTVDGALITAANKFIFKVQKPDYTISGKVTNGTNPVSYAPVWAYQPNGMGHADTMTDASGNYILYVGNGTWVVQANIPGYGDSQAQTVVVNGASMTQNIAPDSSVTYYSISGTVTINDVAQTFMPIRAVEYDSNGNYLGNEYGGQTDSSGAYSISVPGSTGGKYYRVDIWTPEFGEVELTVTDEVANNPANVIVTTADKTGKDITITSGNLNTITLAFTNGLSSQSAIIDIDGVSGTPPKPTGFHKTIKLSTLASSSSVKLADGDYMFQMNVPGAGGFTPVGGNPVTVSGNATVTFTLPDSSTELFTITGTVDDGTDPIEGAWVWMGNPTTGVHFGTTTASDGTYSLTVKSGTYKMGVEMPGYAPQQPTDVVVSVDASGVNYSLTAASQFITGRIYADADSSGSYDSGEEIADGWVWVEETTTKQIAGAPTEVDGTFSIGVVDGTYILRGAAEGYSDTKFGSLITVSGSGSSGNNINLTVDTNWSIKLKSKPMTPASGGTLDDSLSSGTGVKVVAPPNALGNDTSSGTIKAKEVSSISKTSSAESFGGKGKEITAQDNSGQAITSLNDDIEIELNYYKEDITEAGTKDFSKLKLLTNSYWDTSVGDWVPLSTTKKAYTKANASDAEWTAQTDFDAFVDNLVTDENTYGDYKITLQSTTSHLTIFGATTPSDLTAPSAPTGLSQTAGSGTSLTLDWADNSEADLMEYEIYRSISSGVSAIDDNQVNTSQVAVSTFTDSTTTAWTSYYYTVTAVDDSGNESAVATEIRVCSTKTVSNGTVAADCSITCNDGYTISGNNCVANAVPSSGGGGTQLTGSILISNNAAQTTSRNVTLQLSSTGATQMAISNSSDFAGISWESYAVSKEWTLEEGEGLKTVYAKFKNSAGTVSAVASDNITLNTTAADAGTSDTAGTADSADTTGASVDTSGADVNPGGYYNGTLVRAIGDYKVYIVKDGFKRWIQSADIFGFYGHLNFAAVQEVSSDTVDSYQQASLIRADGDPKVYEVNGDGTKHWLNMTAEQFTISGRDWNMVYIINEEELDYYKTGPNVMFVQ
jgi:hypothetical protein